MSTELIAISLSTSLIVLIIVAIGMGLYINRLLKSLDAQITARRMRRERESDIMRGS